MFAYLCAMGKEKKIDGRKNNGGKRLNAGAKKALIPVMPIQFYAPVCTVTKNGGIKNCRNLCKEFLEKYELS